MEEHKLRLPKEGEVLGIVEEKLGGAHFRVACMDDKIRVCRIPGALKRGLWIGLNMVVIVKLWELQSDERGDIIAKYNKQEVKELKRRGYWK